MSADLYARANELVDLEKLAGTPMRRAGRRMRGECPLCGASKGKKTGGAFSIDLQARRWMCWACGEKGDGVALKALLENITPREAAEALVGPQPATGAKIAQVRPEPRRAVAPAAPDEDEAFRAQLAAEIWKTAGRAARSPVETYLRARGLFGPVLELALERLRFHPAVPYIAAPDLAPERWVRLPAMVAIVHSPGGAAGGVHCTFLAPDGRSKTHRDPAKKMLGPQGRDGVPGGAWLASPTGPGALIVAEGIESALSAAILDIGESGEPRRVVAALSLGRLQGGLLADKWGRVDPDTPRPDPERPAFTWPDAGAVVVAVDRDMRPVTVKVRKATGGTWTRALAADDRARVCAALAQAAWRRAGASAARSIAPGPGRDFNDELRARVAAGEVRAA